MDNDSSSSSAGSDHPMQGQVPFDLPRGEVLRKPMNEPGPVQDTNPNRVFYDISAGLNQAAAGQRGQIPMTSGGGLPEDQRYEIGITNYGPTANQT
jgi:hypothetical protein